MSFKNTIFSVDYIFKANKVAILKRIYKAVLDGDFQIISYGKSHRYVCSYVWSINACGYCVSLEQKRSCDHLGVPSVSVCLVVDDGISKIKETDITSEEFNSILSFMDAWVAIDIAERKENKSFKLANFIKGKLQALLLL